MDNNILIISEKDQKDRANTLYLYIENIDGVTYAKFGEAFKQTVWDRYAATGYTQHSKQIKVWKSSVGDKPIHRLLRSMFTWAGNKSENIKPTFKGKNREGGRKRQKANAPPLAFCPAAFCA